MGISYTVFEEKRMMTYIDVNFLNGCGNTHPCHMQS